MSPGVLRVRLRAPPEAVGTRLDRFLADYLGDGSDDELPPLSRARLQRAIDAGQVRMDGAVTKAAARLRGGEAIDVELPEPQPVRLEPEPMDLAVLYEDGDLIALDKPAGLVVHPGAGVETGTLVHGLLAHCRDLSGIGGVVRPGIVHRLDRGTTGVIVVAKNDAAHHDLARQFAERRVVKRYEAFVAGVPQPLAGTIDTPYGRHPTQRRRFSSQVGSGRRAITHYEVAGDMGGASRLSIRLETGRTHQIRVHFADRGHPILGDPVYGAGRSKRLPAGPVRDIAVGLAYPALHAARLELAHPTTGEPLVFEAPLPPHLVRLATLFE